jgi:hypothetical protein
MADAFMHASAAKTVLLLILSPEPHVNLPPNLFFALRIALACAPPFGDNSDSAFLASGGIIQGCSARRSHTLEGEDGT